MEWKNGSNNAANTPLSEENLNGIEDRIARCVQKSGGTMTGSLILKGDPEQDNEAATKKFVEESVQSVKDYTWRDMEVKTGSYGQTVKIKIDGKFNYLIVWNAGGSNPVSPNFISTPYTNTSPTGYKTSGEFATTPLLLSNTSMNNYYMLDVGSQRYFIWKEDDYLVIQNGMNTGSHTLQISVI